MLPLSKTDIKSLDNCINIAIIRIFKISGSTKICYIREMLSLISLQKIACDRLWKFYKSINSNECGLDNLLLKRCILHVALS